MLHERDREKLGPFGAQSRSLKEIKGAVLTPQGLSVVHNVGMGRVPVGLQDFILLPDGLSERAMKEKSEIYFYYKDRKNRVSYLGTSKGEGS